MASLLINSLYDVPFYALLALGFLISFRILAFPDLAVDSSYAAGMACLVAMTNAGLTRIPLLLSLVLATGVGFLIGATTGFLHASRRLRLSKLLAGLVVSFAMFSVNFRLNGGTTTTGLYTTHHELNVLRGALASAAPEAYRLWVLLLCVVVLVLVFSVVAYLLRGGLGVHLRTAGHRPALLTESGASPLLFTMIGLGTANAICAFTGCLRAAVDNYADINTFGTFLYALASLLLGERFLGMFEWGRRNRHMLRVQLPAAIVGGFALSFLTQFSIWTLSSVFNTYMSCDIKLVIAAILLLTGAGSKMGGSVRGSI